MKTKWASALAFCLTGVRLSCLAYDPGADDIVAVTGRTSPGYVRVRQKDGTFTPEYYSFGKGGDWAGSMKDDSMDKLTFLDLAHIIARPLAGQHYIPCTDLENTKLLIMVYWGTTHAPEHANDSDGMVEMQQAIGDYYRSSMPALNTSRGGEPGWSPLSSTRAGGGAALDEVATALTLVEAENDQRRLEDLVNIKMLGYDSWYDNTNRETRGTAWEQSRRDLWDEIEQNRYFVVLMAYDFQLMWKEKRHRLLWETRFSIRQQHHLFDKELPSLAQYASRYFGQETGGLVRDRVPLGQVEIGEVKSLGEAPTTTK